jgi:site-specific DNA-methyltransferase (adenine-specific)
MVFSALVEGGLEYRGQVIRLVQTMRGGDRPKNAELEFPHVSSLPRGAHEPWGVFRKAMPSGMKVSDCLKQFGTGGLRRIKSGNPFSDVIESERTSAREKALAKHPTLKPQSFLRKIVYAALPLGEGIVLDPFMGSGSTLAAAEHLGYQSIGLERYPSYYEMSKTAIPRLAKLDIENRIKNSGKSNSSSSSQTLFL